MRILLVSSSSGSRGGGEIFLKYLGQGLADRGHEVIFWCAQHSRMDELAGMLSRIGRVVRSRYRNFYDHKTRILATSLNRGTSKRLAVEWAELKPDTIHINKQNLEDGLDLLRAADFCAAPSLSTIHITQTASYLGARVARLRDTLARAALRRYRGPLVGVQEARVKELRCFLGNGHAVHTIFNGVPSGNEPQASQKRQAKRQELGADQNTLLVVAVGRMEPQKRPLLFLELAERLHQKAPQTRFVWVGGGSLAPQWDAWVASRNLRGVISRVEWQSDVRPFLFAADLFLHTAAYEGLPIALTEAMTAGLPCAVPRYFLDEVSFFSDETFLVIEDESKLVAALLDKGELQARASRCQSLAKEHFSIERMAADYERLYQGLT
jgi:glycosyltransferase involved in cell wall biosynthesis